MCQNLRMAGLEIIEPTELFNMLNQGSAFPDLSDPNYLLLLDSRKRTEYNESHVITAKHVSKNEAGDYLIANDAELECKTYIVVYDGNTASLKDQGEALDCGRVIWALGSRMPVKVLKGGYEEFSALYPFLRTQKIIYMPREYDDIQTYPQEIIPGLLYLGNWRQGNVANVQKDLKIKAQVNCCEEPGEFFKDNSNVLHIATSDSAESDLHSKFETACDFIDKYAEKQLAVLVFSKLGISRSATFLIAYLMRHFRWTLAEAYNHAKKCSGTVRPNREFVEQLSRWEADIFGQKQTDISDPNF